MGLPRKSGVDLTPGTGNLDHLHFVFLHGLRVRTGTNFLARVVMAHPDVFVVPPDGPTNEFPLLKTLPEWERAFSKVRRRLFGRHPAPEWRDFAGLLGDAWLRLIAGHYGLEGGHVFLKDPHVTRLEEFFDVFPECRLVLLVRDGRDNVASAVRAGLHVRGSMSRRGVLRRRVRHWIMKDFRDHARGWAHAARKVMEFDALHREGRHAGQYMVLRYEDMVQDPRTEGRRLFEFLGLGFDEGRLDGVARTEVVGSSFYGESGSEDVERATWSPLEKTPAFQPVGRWSDWGPVRRRAFKRLAGRELVQLGYAEDDTW